MVVADIDEDADQGMVDNIETNGWSVAIAPETDVGDEADVKSMAEHVEDCFGRVDPLVNNAAIRVDPGPVTEAERDNIDRIIDVNLKGTNYYLTYLIPLIHNGGSIVHVSSVGAEAPRKGWSRMIPPRADCSH